MASGSSTRGIMPGRPLSCLDGCGDRAGGLGHASLDVVDRVLGLLFVFDREAVTVFLAVQRLEEIDRAQIALAQDRERLGVLDVLQMDSVNPLAERSDGIHRVDLRAEEVA